MEAAIRRCRPSTAFSCAARASSAAKSSTVKQADRKSTRLNSSHLVISYAVFCLKKKNKTAVPKDDIRRIYVRDSFILTQYAAASSVTHGRGHTRTTTRHHPCCSHCRRTAALSRP